MSRIFYLVALIATQTIFASTEFFVSTTGNDANPGTVLKPLATLEHARDAIRQLKLSNPSSKDEMVVWLRGGDYIRTNTLELNTVDSGTSASPITWRPYQNETVRLLGGGVLTGFTPVLDPTILARLDAKARGQVFQLNLPSNGITQFGEMKSRGFGRPGTTAHCELFFDHHPMTLARWPNPGQFAKIAGYPAASGHVDEHGANVGQLPGGFLYNGDEPRHWRDISDLWVHGYWSYDWANSYEKVETLDLDQHLVKTLPPYGLYGFRKNQRFYFLNILEELDQPGEWFLDHKTGTLYFWPPSHIDSSVDLQKPEILLSLLDQPLIAMKSASNIIVRGLLLEGTRADAVLIQGGASNLITGCLVRNIGDTAIVINGGMGHGVSDCDISDTGDGGVSLNGGDRQTLKSGGHFVENCHFQRQGRWSKCYVPAIAMTGVGLRASHNLIHDLPHCAILFWGNDHLIDFNEIHHIALETGDVGAIYTGRDYTFRGNKIRNNFIHHTGGVGMGSMGVYMDDCVSGTEVFGNIFYKVHWAMFIGGGRDHRVENNLFVDCDPAVRVDGRGLDKSPVWHEMVNETMRKSLAEMPPALYRERYPEIKSLDRYYGAPAGPAITGTDFKGVPPEDNSVVRNVCVGKWLDTGWNAGVGMLHVENNLTDAASSLVAMPSDAFSAADFTLKKDSPAWTLGFKEIPVAEIGLQKSEQRSHVEGLARVKASSAKNNSAGEQKVFVGYLFRKPAKIDFKLYTHICHAFLTADENGNINTNQFVPSREITTAAHNAGVKVLVSLGGWGWDKQFAAIVNQPEAENRYLRAVLEIVDNYDYDGIDLDWEYPDTAQEVAGFERMARWFRTALDGLGNKKKRQMFETMAAASNSETLKWLNKDLLNQTMDWLNVMTYDMAGEWTDYAGHHSPLFASTKQPGKPRSTELTMKYLLGRGIQPNRLAVGIPLYGKGFAVSEPYASTTSIKDIKNQKVPRGGSYSKLSQLQKEKGWIRKWDDETKNPWLIAPDNSAVIGYDDRESIALKSEWAFNQGFRGVFFWEIGGDLLPDGTNPLQKAAREKLDEYVQKRNDATH
jgi:GH18 family chitinase